MLQHNNQIAEKTTYFTQLYPIQKDEQLWARGQTPLATWILVQVPGVFILKHE